MPSEADRKLLTEAFLRDCIWPSGAPTLEHAWLGIYQMLMWYAYDHIHIREANDLRSNKTWQARAAIVEQQMASELGVGVDELGAHVDRMMQMPRWRDAMKSKGISVTCPDCGHGFIVPTENQRNNPLGNGLGILTAAVLREWGSSKWTYEEEAKAGNWFPGIQMPGRSKEPKVDVVAVADEQARAIISCKWSGRHDRMSDVTNECQEYKAAAIRRQQMKLQHFVITNEMDGQRTDKILNQPCIDGLVLVHLPLAKAMGTMTPMMEQAVASGRLLDLTQFVAATHDWTR